LFRFGLAGVTTVAALGGCATPETGSPAPTTLERHEVGTSPTAGASTSGTITPDSTAVPATTSATDRAREIYNKGVTFFEDKEWDVAIIEFNRALNVDPSFYKAYFKIGLCNYYKRKYDLEIEYYKRSLEIKPDYLECLENLGNALLAQDKLTEAVPVYHRILDTIDPKNPVALFNLGLIYADLQQYDDAIRCLQRYLECTPPDAPDRAKAERHLRRVFEKVRPR
jgi:tetratricopeptide (TPR) repeat protein